MTKIILRIVTALSVMVVLLTGMAWAEMVIHLKNGQEIRHPVDRGDVASIEYTDSGHHGGRGKENGTPWVVNSNGNIFRRTGGSWQMLPGLAKDIGVGADGSVWVIGMDSTGGGYSIHQWNGSNWTRIDGGAIRIAVAPDGNPWVVNSNDNIFRRTGGSWQMLPGLAKDIGVGADGSVWVIGTDSTGGGYGIHRWNGSNWTKIDGGAVQITVR